MKNLHIIKMFTHAVVASFPGLFNLFPVLCVRLQPLVQAALLEHQFYKYIFLLYLQYCMGIPLTWSH